MRQNNTVVNNVVRIGYTA